MDTTIAWLMVIIFVLVVVTPTQLFLILLAGLAILGQFLLAVGAILGLIAKIFLKPKEEMR